MLYDIRQGQMLVQGVSTYHINRRMSTRIMIYYFYYTTMDLFPVRVMMSRENHPTFYLQERDPHIAGILAAFCLIDGVEIGALRCRDSSTGLFPETSEFDRILTEPSFSYERTDTRTDLSERDLIPEIATTMEMFPFSLAASRLSKRGIAVIKCNLSLLYGSSSNKQKGRTELVNRNLIDAVIELPPELLSEPGETAALVIIRKGRKEDTIHMIAGYSRK